MDDEIKVLEEEMKLWEGSIKEEPDEEDPLEPSWPSPRDTDPEEYGGGLL